MWVWVCLCHLLFLSLTNKGIGLMNVDQPHFRHSMRLSALATSPVRYFRVHSGFIPGSRGANYKDGLGF